MIKYRATAYNSIGYTWQFCFFGSGTEAEARAALAELVAADRLHQANGPWHVRGVTREA